MTDFGRSHAPVAVLSLVVLAIAGCSASVPEPSHAPVAVTTGGFDASESVYFSNLAELLATADLTVIATVEAVESGEVDRAGSPDEIHHTNVVLIPEQTLRGDPVKSVVVETLELAYGHPHGEWRTAGTRVLAFLTASTEGRQIYIPTNHSQSIYLIEGDRLSPSVENPVGAEISRLRLDDLASAIEKAKRDIANGTVKAKSRSE